MTTDYQYTIPNSNCHGVSLKIQNSGDIVNGIYSAVGVFVDNGDGTRYPLLTAGKQELVDIPAYSVIYIEQKFQVPILFRENCRIIVDSTDLPNTCTLTPTFLLEVKGDGVV